MSSDSLDQLLCFDELADKNSPLEISRFRYPPNIFKPTKCYFLARCLNLIRKFLPQNLVPSPQKLKVWIKGSTLRYLPCGEVATLQAFTKPVRDSSDCGAMLSVT